MAGTGDEDGVTLSGILALAAGTRGCMTVRV
jgi:hypothetical protein